MKKIFVILIILLQNALIGQRTISMNFDLYQNAANNITAIEGSFPLIYSNNIGDNDYYFELEQPTIEFNQNLMKMIAVLKINTTPTGYFEIEIQPSIGVNYSLSTDNVTAFLQNFSNYINSAFPQIPNWIRTKIIEHYESLQLEIYPAKLIEYAENFVPNYLAIEVSNIAFSFQSLPGKLQGIISFEVTGVPPRYRCYTYNRTHVKITSNVRVDIKKLKLLILNGSVFYDFNGTIPIEKDGEAIFDDVYNENNQANSSGGRRIWVVLQSDVRGTFLRVYNADYMPHDNQWSDPLPMLQSFD